MDTTTTANNMVLAIENGKVVYPCRCGVTHTGDYALEDYLHHECLHEEPLIHIATDATSGTIQMCCPVCGADFSTTAKEMLP